MLQRTLSPPLRVLVVDDLPDMTQSMAALLRLWGHDVRTANNGQQALDVADNYHPEVVLLDVSMPGMDGYQVAQRMRSDPSQSSAFLVSVTGHAGEAAERSREAGCDRHMLKPVNPDELQRLLAQRKAKPEADDLDDTCRADAENRLRHHPYLALRRISCACFEGELTLRGYLPTYYLKQLAQAAVAGITGVQRVHNEIKVGSSIPVHPC